MLRDRRLQLGQGHAKASGVTQHLADEGSGLPGALAGPAFRRDLAHERSRPLAHLDEPLALQVAVGLRHRGRVHAQLCGEVPHRGERRTRAELARGDRHAQAIGDLGVQRRWATGVQLLKHGSAMCIIVIVQ